MLKSMGLDDAAHVTYRDSAKHPIRFEKFRTLLMQGYTAEIDKNDASRSVLLTLSANKHVSHENLLVKKQFPAFHLKDIHGHPVSDSD